MTDYTPLTREQMLSMDQDVLENMPDDEFLFHLRNTTSDEFVDTMLDNLQYLQDLPIDDEAKAKVNSWKLMRQIHFVSQPHMQIVFSMLKAKDKLKGE